MRDVRRILTALEAVRDTPVVLATVLRTRGPAYRRAGAMALLAADGRLLAGGVSAGCLEDDVSARAGAVLADGRSARVAYDADAGVFGIPSGCGGQVEVLLEPVADAEARGALLGWLRALDGLGDVGTAGLVLHERADGHGGHARVIATADGEWWFNAVGGDGLRPAMRTDVRRDAPRIARGRFAGLLAYGGVAVAWHPVAPRPTLVIGGAMPDARPVARHALALDWDVTVIDHRPGRLEAFDVPGAATRDAGPGDVGPCCGGDRFTAALVMYHAEAADAEALHGLVARPPGLVGVLGPRRRTARLLEGSTLADAPWPAWLRAPVGLDLGADDADEIAVSIVAELLAWQRGAGGVPLAGREGPLHPFASVDGVAGTEVPWPSAAAVPGGG